MLRPLFVLSLPRTGSTFLQRMLAGHSQIATPDESWVLLPFLYSLRGEGVYAEYGHRAATDAITHLCQSMRGGRQAYLEEVKELALRLYGRLSPPGAAYYLDKTPRYHLVVDDLLELFPEGRFVFLWRDPRAVVASMLASGTGLQHHKIDLYAGLANLVDAFTREGGRCHALRYEELVEDPRREMARLLTYLELQVEELAPPVESAPLGKWREVLGTPLRRAWSRRYLRWIGAERLGTMGYDLDDLVGELSGIPVRPRPAADVSLALKQWAWPLLEPAIVRDKATALARRHRLYHHW